MQRLFITALAFLISVSVFGQEMIEGYSFQYSIAVLIALSRTTILGKYSGGGFGVPVACHTLAQILMGGVAGVMFTFVFMKHYGHYILENEKKVRFTLPS